MSVEIKNKIKINLKNNLKTGLKINLKVKVNSPPNLKTTTNVSCENIGISLFSGAGGDTIGLTNSGYNVKYFSEFNRKAIETHKLNHVGSLLISQDNKVDISLISNETFNNVVKDPINLVFAGFPCQGFSHAGKKNENDPRNELVHQFVRVVDIFKPQWIIGENVKGLLSRKGWCPITGNKIPVIEIIEKLFNRIGYQIVYNVINAVDVGVPQLRKRLIIVGHRGLLYPNIKWPIPNVGNGNGNGLRHILLSTLEGAIKYDRNHNKENEYDSYWIPTDQTTCSGSPHPNLIRLNSGIRNLTQLEKTLPETKDKTQIIEPDLISFGKRKTSYHGEIINPDQPSKTIICTYGTCPRLFVGLVDPTGQKWIRCLLPSELAQIQGFPKDYIFTGNPSNVIKQIGNAVPPQIVSYVCNQFKDCSFSNTSTTEINNYTEIDDDED